MKSSGRHHKPVNNELAQWLGEHIEEWKPHFPLIGIVAVALLVGGVLYLVAFSGDDNSSAPSWSAYYSAFGKPKLEEALQEVATEQKGKAAAHWALLALADNQMQQATQELARDSAKAKTKFADAEKTLKEAEAAAGASEKEFLARVHTNLAKVNETSNKIDEARKYFEMVAKTDDPEGTLGKSAAKALKRLEKGSDVPELLAWLDTQKGGAPPAAAGNPFSMRREPLPERPDLSIPGEMKLDGPKGSSPLGPSPLDTPPLDLKGLPGLDKPTETPKTETPAAEEPKTKAPAVPKPVKPAVPTPVKPAEEKKTDEKPAEEKKAEEKKPSEEKKSEEK